MRLLPLTLGRAETADERFQFFNFFLLAFVGGEEALFFLAAIISSSSLICT
jgi:hypothetical protein